jgi:hypothetical protein
MQTASGRMSARCHLKQMYCLEFQSYTKDGGEDKEQARTDIPLRFMEHGRHDRVTCTNREITLGATPVAWFPHALVNWAC